ncbi:protein of unknown function [Streptomyces sp. KY75]|nr:protein of unknown function [Streptomyces sp. KY75]CAD5975405.1 protein of unknown function [Streptomyces sp. KY70]
MSEAAATSQASVGGTVRRGRRRGGTGEPVVVHLGAVANWTLTDRCYAWVPFNSPAGT